MGSKKNLYIIDTHSLIYKAYYAIRELSTSDGRRVNAVFGFAKMLFKIIKDFSPDNIIAAYDVSRKSFRTEMFKEYKANRSAMPDDLRPQIPIIQDMLKRIGVPNIYLEGFEADDIIGSICRQYKDDFNIFILSGDKDLLQLVDNSVRILNTKKGISTLEVLDRKEIEKKYGIKLEQFIDYLGLVGDTSDNVPGVKGIGPKTAEKLLKKWESIEDIYSKIDKVEPSGIKDKLIRNKDNAFLSKELVTIKQDVSFDLDIKSTEFRKSKLITLAKLFEELEFVSLLKDIEDISGGEVKQIEIPEYKTVDDTDSLEACLDDLSENKELFIWFQFDGNELVFIAVKSGRGRLYFLNFTELSLESIVKFTKIFSKDINIISYNLKKIIKFVEGFDIKVRDTYFDMDIALYLLPYMQKKMKITDLFFTKLGYKVKDITEVEYGEVDLFNKKFDETYIVQTIQFISCFEKLYHIVVDDLKKEGLFKVYNEIELPLIKVLVFIEREGIKIDEEYLKEIKKKVSSEIEILKSKIFAESGDEFNLNSPKQLADILFNKLGLKPGKKTKTQYSTDNEVLKELSYNDICRYILFYRKYTKILSGYIEPILEKMDANKKIHSSFNQDITATGRLSSSNPNLQNLPVDYDLKFSIRKSFVTESFPGDKLIFVSADYSQIELRVLAHLSGDENLINAFKNSIDIHSLTAERIFGVDRNKIDKKLRRVGKTINFGIIYGMSVHGLATALDIDYYRAKEFIDKYFKVFNKVDEYLKKTMEFCRENGYVYTIFGRKRNIPLINDKNVNVRKSAERMAINMPVQGTAADIIKIAMIETFKIQEVYGARMLLTIHDELVFEIEKKDAEKFSKKIKNIMENIIELKVPLIVDIKTGITLGDL